jgi:uncharacterized protein (TIGR02594 family)
MRQHVKQQHAYMRAVDAMGLQEIKGPIDNPEIVQMFADVGHEWVKDDETAWCAAFVGAMLERSGLRSTRALNARSYLDWGEAVPIEDAKPGDIVVFWREDPNSWKGHVGFFSRDAGGSLEVLGGNQSDAVNVQIYSEDKLLGVRRWPASGPETSRPATRPSGLAALLTRLFSFLSKGGPA